MEMSMTGGWVARWGIVLLVAAAACKATVVPSGGAETYPPLENTTWKLIELDGRAVELAPEQREPHIVLKPESGEDDKGGEETPEKTGRLVGSGGCNRISGGYVRDAESIRIGPLISTRMACPEPIMDVESAFLRVLEKADRYEIQGDALTLSDGQSVRAQFEPTNSQ